jgi:basic membrane protein A
MRNLYWISPFLMMVFLSTAHAAEQIGLVLDLGGKDDKSFNAAAYLGASKAQKELGVEVKTVEAGDDQSFEPMMRNFARKKMSLIIAVGISQADAVKKVATQFPDISFALVDAQVDLPNVRSLLFQEHQGSFLVGAIAAMVSKSKTFGFIGGMDIPLIRRFQMGYEAGIKHIEPTAKVISNYVGVTSEAWNNPPKGKELALAQYQKGAEVIFAAAGASNGGLFDAVEEKKKFAIGVDSNQNWVKPGLVLTSMMKRVDVAVFQAISDIKTKKFTGGVARFGLENQGIDFAVDEFNKKVLPQSVIDRANKLKQEIISGKLKVPDFYQKNAK